MGLYNKEKKETLLAQAGSRWDKQTGAISMPIYPSATYAHPSLGQSTGFDYSRTANPTNSVAEDVLAKLDNGANATLFSTGMAAIDAFFRLFSEGDTIIVAEDLYGGTWRLIENIRSTQKAEILYVNSKELISTPLWSERKISAIFFETPTNPTLSVVDIRSIVEKAHSNNAIVAIDNTFLTGLSQPVIDLGADIAIYSGTKYLAGHNDLLCGVVISKDIETGEKLQWIKNTFGATLSPFDSWLLIRGLKTLPLRLKQQEENSLKVAHFLENHSSVYEVNYPGLESHPDHLLQKSQSSSFGAIISFTVKDRSTVAKILKNVKIWLFAESLGGVESLITYPWEQTHADIPENIREKTGVTRGLIRLSVGIESADDLINDLKRALEANDE